MFVSAKLCFLILLVTRYASAYPAKNTDASSEQIGQDSIEISDFKLNWITHEKTVEFVFKTKVSELDQVWAAFAFSKDQRMGDDDVALCNIKDNKSILLHYHNTVHARPSILDEKNPQIGFSNIYVEIKDNWLTCSFIRVKQMEDVPNYFDINDEHYILFATGTLLQGELNRHDSKVYTSKTIDFKYIESSITKATTTTTQISPVSSVSKYESEIQTIMQIVNESIILMPDEVLVNSRKNKTKKINFRERKTHLSYSQGPFRLCWSQIDKENVHFKFSTNISQLGHDKIWSSFALSSDKVWADDALIVCSAHDDQFNITHYRTHLDSLPSLINPLSPSLGLTNTSVNITNDMLVCTFNRQINITNFDLHHKYYLIFRNGTCNKDENTTDTHNMLSQQPNYLVSHYKIGFLGTNFESILSSFATIFNFITRKFFPLNY
jgi:hypothetical protein